MVAVTPREDAPTRTPGAPASGADVLAGTTAEVIGASPIEQTAAGRHSSPSTSC